MVNYAAIIILNIADTIDYIRRKKTFSSLQQCQKFSNDFIQAMFFLKKFIFFIDFNFACAYVL